MRRKFQALIVAVCLLVSGCGTAVAVADDAPPAITAPTVTPTPPAPRLQPATMTRTRTDPAACRLRKTLFARVYTKTAWHHIQLPKGMVVVATTVHGKYRIANGAIALLHGGAVDCVMRHRVGIRPGDVIDCPRALLAQQPLEEGPPWHISSEPEPLKVLKRKVAENVPLLIVQAAVTLAPEEGEPLEGAILEAAVPPSCRVTRGEGRAPPR